MPLFENIFGLFCQVDALSEGCNFIERRDLPIITGRENLSRPSFATKKRIKKPACGLAKPAAGFSYINLGGALAIARLGVP